ncbi:MAG: Gfo/Idh/MocA family oxidoreductase, partial [Candidatus Sumerlaeota bacterium]|nr:Gfo/Idh/MocA family oxidoreductase [Candidatus Sumerlaeota bacterium]
AAAYFIPNLHAAPDDPIKVGLVGCGRRGTSAAQDCIKSSKNVSLVAMCDVFKDKVDGAYNGLKKSLGESFKVTPETCFTGFDGYQKVIAAGVDVVLLCVPPGFRPDHLEACVKAGKHVFIEKPAAVDPVGVRSVIASGELAKEKKLCIVAGTQRRHQKSYLETIKRIQDGQMGDVVSGEVYWLGDYNYYAPVQKKPEWSDMEWQLRNWNYFAWLSGDHIVEQHVHNLDIAHWILGDPVKCIATGSRAIRTDPVFGHIFDNFSCSFEYPNGANLTSMCRQMNGINSRVSERFHGGKGHSYTDQGGNGTIKGFKGEVIYDCKEKGNNPYVQEHTDLIAAIREGKPINEAAEVAKSTMMAVLGRICAYTGKEVNWDWVMKASKLDLRPAKLELGPLEVAPVAVPGKTQLV